VQDIGHSKENIIQFTRVITMIFFPNFSVVFKFDEEKNLSAVLLNVHINYVQT